ncbi:MAG: VapC toxin family domain ribonuclease [Devosia sp.]|uniref:type II toxin-antitoxin system VapC family toxin n=1 Tax=Devosia sp. TaxID=1871048 RepID=UPI002636C79E|nr:type II toxin-antitoxin system VapC family toxin [Devosia sp.]MDB5540417.1 VapC toxin family domain ribonuclease [Devosia sp.]
MARRNSLLLDTCAAIWLTQQSPMQPEAVEAIDEASDAGQPVRLSLITSWELGLLAKSGRAAMAQAPAVIFRAFLQLPGVMLEGLTPEILIDSSLLPTPVHGDPADRIIIATARALDLTIVTRDRLILDYAAHGHVRALAC